MIAAVLVSFVVALIFLFLGEFIKGKFFKFVSLIPFSLFVYFATFASSVSNGSVFLNKNPWIPSMGISLDFKLDGLSLLFALLITGVGTLIYLYASSYLKGHKYLNRFYSYLSIFMGSMLGLVLSDNVLSMFVFWELTSISSFFLIGFDNENEDARKSALQALGITGLGGFLLMSGAILLGMISNTFSIQEMLQMPHFIKSDNLYGLVIFLFFAGAFTKSAQFPFHFWLPGAMKAPTPVSAYLHSATMVKAGIYLLARFTPILGGDPLWNNTLMIVGGITMLYAAFHSLFRTDLKGILAYSTISALGMMVFLLGIGSPYALMAVSVFILVHALYKAALFLITGTLDHSVHTRNVTELSGLRTVMPGLTIAGFLAAFSNAGIPLTFGFIGKDLIYEATLHTAGILAIALTALAVLTNIFLLYAGFLAGIQPFMGKLTTDTRKIHLPDPYLWIPPLLLGILGLFYGIFPQVAENTLISSVARAVSGHRIDIHLKIWHGFNIVLALSLCTILLGTILYLVRKPSARSLDFIGKFDNASPKHLVEVFTSKTRDFAFSYTKLMHNGYLRLYILVIIVFLTGLVGYKLFADVPIRINTTGLSEFRLYELVVFFIMVIAIFFTVTTNSRLTAIACLSVLGYSICLIFVFYGAPDLAMTQFTIDTLTVVLFVLVLFKLPSYIKRGRFIIQARDAVVSAAFGALMSLITLQALVAPASKEISKYYAENAYILAKGKNVVNVILVDFRGFDTLIETIVLSIAAIGVYGLLKYKPTAAEGKID